MALCMDLSGTGSGESIDIHRRKMVTNPQYRRIEAFMAPAVLSG